MLANIEGFWDPLLTLFKRMQSETFIRPGLELKLELVDRVTDILPVITRAIRTAEPEEAVTAKF